MLNCSSSVNCSRLIAGRSQPSKHKICCLHLSLGRFTTAQVCVILNSLYLLPTSLTLKHYVCQQCLDLLWCCLNPTHGEEACGLALLIFASPLPVHWTSYRMLLVVSVMQHGHLTSLKLTPCTTLLSTALHGSSTGWCTITLAYGHCSCSRIAGLLGWPVSGHPASIQCEGLLQECSFVGSVWLDNPGDVLALGV